MNIAQLFNRTLYYLDSPRSPRFAKSKVIATINTAINQIVDDLIDAGKNNNNETKGFETNQRLKDSLSTLVSRSAEITASKSNPTDTVNNFISRESITDHRQTIGLRVYISGKWYWAAPLDHEQKYVVNDDPFSRPSLIEPARIYRVEEGNGCEVLWGDIGVPSKGYFEYIKNPAVVSLGILKDPPAGISVGLTIIALTNATLSINGISYNLTEGQQYSVASTGVTVFSGTVIYGYTNTDLPERLHEDIAKAAAALLTIGLQKQTQE